MPKTKQLSFNYQLEKEGITLEVNFEGSDIDEDFVVQKIDEAFEKQTLFRTRLKNKIYIPCSGMFAEVIKERYADLFLELGVQTSYNANTADLVLICNPSKAKLKSVIFNNQNILPILEHLEATDKIHDEAVKVAWKEFNS
jgi:hypothetical protein